MAAADPHVKVVHHPVNRKLGGSIKTGFAAATGDLVLYTDADLPFDMAEVHKAIRLMRYYEADIVCAYRFDRIGEGPSPGDLHVLLQHPHPPPVRGAACATSTSPSSCAGGRSSTTSSCSSEGSFIDAELIIRARKLGFHVIQFGVDYFPRTRGESTLSSLGGHPHDPARDVRTCARSCGASRRSWGRRPTQPPPPSSQVEGFGAGGGAETLTLAQSSLTVPRAMRVALGEGEPGRPTKANDERLVRHTLPGRLPR